jgi:hypothetical protein
MKVERVTVSFEVSRSRNYQSVKYSLSEVLVLEEGDDRDAVVKAARKRLFLEVNDTAAKALAHVLADSEPPQETTG